MYLDNVDKWKLTEDGTKLRKFKIPKDITLHSLYWFPGDPYSEEGWCLYIKVPYKGGKDVFYQVTLVDTPDLVEAIKRDNKIE